MDRRGWEWRGDQGVRGWEEMGVGGRRESVSGVEVGLWGFGFGVRELRFQLPSLKCLRCEV